MSSKPFGLHQTNYPHSSYDTHEQHPHNAQLPAIPDLRFEYSYLRSIQRFITVTPSHRSLTVHDEKRLRISQESVDIQWGKVVWITMRDQVISPLLQGALCFNSDKAGLLRAIFFRHLLLTLGRPLELIHVLFFRQEKDLA
ncbi:hypothetical protein H0H92_015635 [Tricholoma furcatifolium]|nr:hypothetical protein H0H92_015635 [Tricholoma furcatifolium]